MRLNVLILNDDPQVAECQKRLIEALSPPDRVGVVIRTTVADAFGFPFNHFDLLLVDPGASAGIRHLVSSHYDEDARIVVVTGHPLAFIPEQPLEIPCEQRIQWGENGTFNKFILEWLSSWALV